MKNKAKKRPKVTEEERKSSFKFLVCNGFVYFICFMAFTVIGIIYAVQLRDVENANKSFRAWHKIYIGAFILATICFVLVVLICCAKRHENRGNRQEVNGTIGVIYLMLWVAFFGCCAAGGFLGSFMVHTEIFPGCDRPSTSNEIYDTCFLYYVPHTIAFILFFGLFFFVILFGCYQRSDRAEKLMTPQEDLDAVKEEREKKVGISAAARWRESAKVMNEKGFIRRSRISKISPLPPLVQNMTGQLVFSDAVEEIILATRIDRANQEYIPKVTYIKKKEGVKDNILNQPLPPLPVLPKQTTSKSFQADYPSSPDITKSFPDDNNLAFKSSSGSKKKKKSKSKNDSQTDETSGYTSIDETKLSNGQAESPDDVVAFCSKECLENFKKSDPVESTITDDAVTPSDLLLEKDLTDKSSSPGTSVSGTSDDGSGDTDSSQSRNNDEIKFENTEKPDAVVENKSQEDIVSIQETDITASSTNGNDTNKDTLATQDPHNDKINETTPITTPSHTETPEETQPLATTNDQETPVPNVTDTNSNENANTEKVATTEGDVEKCSSPDTEHEKSKDKASEDSSQEPIKNNTNQIGDKHSNEKNQLPSLEEVIEDETVTSTFLITQKEVGGTEIPTTKATNSEEAGVNTQQNKEQEINTADNTKTEDTTSA